MQGRQSWECGTDQRPPILKLDEKHPLLFFSVFNKNILKQEPTAKATKVPKWTL